MKGLCRGIKQYMAFSVMLSTKEEIPTDVQFANTDLK